jgi:hypothetical protein
MRLMRTVPIVLLLPLIGCARAPGGDPLRVVPIEADAALIAPSVADLQAHASRFLAGIEGASGALDLVADRYGLDLRSPEGPSVLGLDPARGFALYAQPMACDAPPCPRALVAAASVADPERFLEAIGSRLRRAAGLTADPIHAASPLQVFRNDHVAVALGVTPDRVGLLALVPSGDPVPLWNAASAGPEAARRLVDSPRDKAAQALLGDATLRLVTGQLLPEVPDSLGLVRGVLTNIRDKLPSWQGAIAISDDSLKIKLSGGDPAGAPDATLPVSWLNPEKPEPSPLSHVFPKTTTALLRLRVNLAKVRAMPSFLRERVLPEQLPFLEAAPLPVVNDLLEYVEGDIALAFLGLDPKATLASFARGLTPQSFGMVHLAMAARLRDPGGLERAFSGIAEQLGTSGWAVASISGKPPTDKSLTPWKGWTFARDGQHYSVLLDGRVCVFIVGEGEVDGFLAVRDGRALPLSVLADNAPLLSDALGLTPSGGSFAALIFTPLRLGRELAARSVPPYFLKVLNDLRVASLSLDATDKTVTLSLEVDL